MLQDKEGQVTRAIPVTPEGGLLVGAEAAEAAEVCFSLLLAPVAPVALVVILHNFIRGMQVILRP